MPGGKAHAGELPTAKAAPVQDEWSDASATQVPGMQTQSGESASSALIPGQGLGANTRIKETRPLTGNEDVIGLGETALQYATGLPAMLAGQGYGLYRQARYGDNPDVAAGQAASAMTYAPRTVGGKAWSEYMPKLLTEDLKLPPYIAHLGLGESVKRPSGGVEQTAEAMRISAAKDQAAALRSTPTPAPSAILNRLPPTVRPGETMVADAAGNIMPASQREAMLNALQDEQNAKNPSRPLNIYPSEETQAWEAANKTARDVEAARDLSAESRATALRGQGVSAGMGVSPQPPVPDGIDTSGALAPTDFDKLWGPGATVGNVTNLQGTPTTLTTGDISKTATDTSGKGGRDYNDFLLNLGLGLMAGKSPYALQNLGEAGLGALRQEQETKKQTLQERQAASLEVLQKQQGQYLGAQAGYLESLKGPQAALELAEKRFDAWSKTPAGMQLMVSDPAKANQTYKDYVQGAYKDLGIIHPSMMSPETAGFMSKYGVQ
jgi:hypothetical protein